MEGILLIVGLIVLGIASDWFEKFVSKKKSISKPDFDLEVNVKEHPIQNNYNINIQNNTHIKKVYVQQNNYQQNNYQTDGCSTTKIAQENGLTGPKLFSMLVSKGYVYKEGRKHFLTSKGKSAGGSYDYTDSGNKYIVWSTDIVSKVTKTSTNSVKYSEEGLAKKLFGQTKSAGLTKSILVDEYGISDYKAKRLVDRINY